MNQLSDPRNRNYLIAGIGSLVAFVAFFMPFISWGYGLSLSGAQIGGYLWLSELLIIASLAASALFIYRPQNPLGSPTISLVQQTQWASYTFLGAGGLGVLFTLFSLGGGGIGAWLYIAGCIAVGTAGVLMITNKTAMLQDQHLQQTNPYNQQYPPQQQQQPQYPSQPPYPQTEYPQTGYPPQQYPPQQQQQPQQQPPQYPPYS